MPTRENGAGQQGASRGREARPGGAPPIAREADASLSVASLSVAALFLFIFLYLILFNIAAVSPMSGNLHIGSDLGFHAPSSI